VRRSDPGKTQECTRALECAHYAGVAAYGAATRDKVTKKAELRNPVSWEGNTGEEGKTNTPREESKENRDDGEGLMILSREDATFASRK